MRSRALILTVPQVIALPRSKGTLNRPAFDAHLDVSPEDRRHCSANAQQTTRSTGNSDDAQRSPTMRGAAPTRLISSKLRKPTLLPSRPGLAIGEGHNVPPGRRVIEQPPADACDDIEGSRRLSLESAHDSVADRQSAAAGVCYCRRRRPRGHLRASATRWSAAMDESASGAISRYMPRRATANPAAGPYRLRTRRRRRAARPRVRWQVLAGTLTDLPQGGLHAPGGAADRRDHPKLHRFRRWGVGRAQRVHPMVEG
jgi:hypothetical protein